MHLSIIIPVFNESKLIEKTLGEIINFLSTKKYNSEIIIVNDGSTDNTIEIVTNFSKSYPILIIDNKNNQGKGSSVREGMLMAQGSHCLFMDADNSTPIAELDALLPYSEQGFDVVLGSRRMNGSQMKHCTLLRNILSKIFILLVKFIIPLQVTDSQNGFKVFHKKSIKLIFSRQTIKRWAFDVEILLIARTLNLTIKEVPIQFINFNQSKMNFKGMVNMMMDVMKIKINMLKGKY